jgi:hypothetical protein
VLCYLLHNGQSVRFCIGHSTQSCACRHERAPCRRFLACQCAASTCALALRAASACQAYAVERSRKVDVHVILGVLLSLLHVTFWLTNVVVLRFLGQQPVEPSRGCYTTKCSWRMCSLPRLKIATRRTWTRHQSRHALGCTRLWTDKRSGSLGR